MCDSYPEFYDQRIVKARKAHKCCELGCAIIPGDQYERFSGKWEGDFHCYSTCLACVEKRKVVSAFGSKNWNDDCYLFGGLTDAMHEMRTWNSEGAALYAKLHGIELVEDANP